MAERIIPDAPQPAPKPDPILDKLISMEARMEAMEAKLDQVKISTDEIAGVSVRAK